MRGIMVVTNRGEGGRNVMGSMSLAGKSCAICLWLVLVFSAHGDTGGRSVTLAWDANEEPDLAGYKLYYGVLGEGDTNRMDRVLTNQYTVGGLELGQTYFFYVTAYNESGLESDPSNRVIYFVDEEGSFPAKKDTDVTGDDFPDILFQNDQGYLQVWSMDGAERRYSSLLIPHSIGDTDWRAVGTADFDFDQKPDLLFQHSAGWLSVWLMNGIVRSRAVRLNPDHPGDADWRAVALTDLNHDGQTDILFQHANGDVAVWIMDGLDLQYASFFSPRHPGERGWRLVCAADMGGDNQPDLLFQHENGELMLWHMNFLAMKHGRPMSLASPGSSSWQVLLVIDLDLDGNVDLLFQHQRTSSLAVWFMEKFFIRKAVSLTPDVPGGSWRGR